MKSVPRCTALYRTGPLSRLRWCTSRPQPIKVPRYSGTVDFIGFFSVLQKVDLLAGFVLLAMVQGVVAGSHFPLLGQFPLVAIDGDQRRLRLFQR